MIFMILNWDQVPVSIGEWQQAVRNEIQRKNMISASLGNRTDAPYKPQWKPVRGRRHRDPDAMDVDAAVTEERPKEAKKLTTEEKQKRMREGRCFSCGRLGHMSQACPKKGDKGKTEPRKQARAVTAKGSESGRDEEEPPTYDASGLMAHIRAMDAEERDSFLDRLMLADKQGF